MTKEQLNFEPFYYVEPMRIIDNDPDASIELFLKYSDEKDEIEDFLKQCNLEDFISVITSIFKNEFADGALLSSLISETISKEETTEGLLIYKKPRYRNDIKNLKFKYTNEDHFEYLDFDIVNTASNLNDILERVLASKQYSQEGYKYVLEPNSGIDYIELTSNKFKLKANMSKSKKFH